MVDPVRTVFIWDECGEAPIRFFTLSGDFRKFMGVYIGRVHPLQNMRPHDKQMQKELMELVYDEKGQMKVVPMGGFPTHEVKAGAHVIVCGAMT